MRKSWLDKFNAPRTHQVKPVPVNIAGMKTGEIMLVPTPKIIDAFIAGIPFGSTIDVKTLRAKLARRYRAQVTCPITTGFHLRAVAEVAIEKMKGGATPAEVTPFWRVLDENAPTTARLSCGQAFVVTQRKAEGIQGAGEPPTSLRRRRKPAATARRPIAADVA